MNGLHGIVFSYEKRNNLRELGEIRSASSIPFGGRYRAIDFSLSNLVNAGCTDVGVVLHGSYQSLLDHLGTGKDWDLSRKHGGLKILPPFAYQQAWGEAAFRGKMEALAGVRSYLQEIRQDYVVMMDGDLVVNLPLGEIVQAHIASGADITAVCGADSFRVENGTYFQLSPEEDRVTDVLYHLNMPRGNRGLEVYLLSRAAAAVPGGRVREPRPEYSWRSDVLQARRERLEHPGLDLEGLCRADPLGAGVLRPQYAAFESGISAGSCSAPSGPSAPKAPTSPRPTSPRTAGASTRWWRTAAEFSERWRTPSCSPV
jgi:glucose-1-phosphate adenylyltransferase